MGLVFASGTILTRAGVGVAGLGVHLSVAALALASTILRFRVGAGPLEGQLLGARAASLGTLADGVDRESGPASIDCSRHKHSRSIRSSSSSSSSSSAGSMAAVTSSVVVIAKAAVETVVLVIVAAVAAAKTMVVVVALTKAAMVEIIVVTLY